MTRIQRDSSIIWRGKVLISKTENSDITKNGELLATHGKLHPESVVKMAHQDGARLHVEVTSLQGPQPKFYE